MTRSASKIEDHVEVRDPAVQRRLLRHELRSEREAAGKKQAEVARAMDWSPSKLIRIERGDVSVSTNDLKALMSYYGVKDHVKVNRLLNLARLARASSFYDQYADMLGSAIKEYVAHEASASVLRQYDPAFVPGLLQTEEYARGLFEGQGTDQVTADRGWSIRQHRQKVHDREPPLEMLVVVDEAALRRQVGRGQSMRHQVERIKEYAAKPNISIQIMPFARGAHPGMLGNFNILEFADPNLEDLVYVETTDGATASNDIELVAKYLDIFGKLQEMSLTPEDSVEFLDEIIRDMSSHRRPMNLAEKEAT
jgi:transcriptional regulator with XRE-family HTH domain